VVPMYLLAVTTFSSNRTLHTSIAPSLNSAYVRVANSALFPKLTATRSPLFTPSFCSPLQACSSRDQARRRSSVCVGDVILLYLNVSQLVLGASLGRTCTRHGRHVASQPPQSAAAQSSPAMAAILTSVSTITSSESSEDTSVGPTLYACVRRPRRAQWVDLGDLAARAKSDRIIFARRMHRM
jgi:hypothetical protein